MKNLLYISVNSKPENLSSSKTVARAFIEKFMKQNKDYNLEELDLYKIHIPRLEYKFFEKRNALVKKNAMEKLSVAKQEEVHKITELADQFINADLIVIAAPMWNLSFPALLKEYIDCIVIDGKTINITSGKPEGLLKNKMRTLVYIQSSGADINLITSLFMNRGVNYVKDITKLMGIKRFEEIFVDGTGFTENERIAAVTNAINNLDEEVSKITEFQYA